MIDADNIIATLGEDVHKNLAYFNRLHNFPDCFLSKIDVENVFCLDAFQAFINDVVALIQKTKKGRIPPQVYSNLYVELFSIYSHTLRCFAAHYDLTNNFTLKNFHKIGKSANVILKNYEIVMQKYLSQDYEDVKGIEIDQISWRW